MFVLTSGVWGLLRCSRNKKLTYNVIHICVSTNTVAIEKAKATCTNMLDMIQTRPLPLALDTNRSVRSASFPLVPFY